jgi:hypothetical protein
MRNDVADRHLFPTPSTLFQQIKFYQGRRIDDTTIPFVKPEEFDNVYKGMVTVLLSGESAERLTFLPGCGWSEWEWQDALVC